MNPCQQAQTVDREKNGHAWKAPQHVMSTDVWPVSSSQEVKRLGEGRQHNSLFSSIDNEATMFRTLIVAR